MPNPLYAALDAVLPAFAPPPLSKDEAHAIGVAVAACSTSDEPVEVPSPAGADLSALMHELNRGLHERRIPVTAYLRDAGIETVIEGRLKREVEVPAAIMVRRVMFGGRKR